MSTGALILSNFPNKLEVQLSKIAPLLALKPIRIQDNTLDTHTHSDNTILAHYFNNCSDIPETTMAARSSVKEIAITPSLTCDIELQLIEKGYFGAVNANTCVSGKVAALNEVQSGLLSFSRRALALSVIQHRPKIPTKNSIKIMSMVTKKEQQVLQLISSGLSNKQISEQMNISINTVKMHIQNIYKKAEISNRSQLFAALNNT